MSKLTIQQHNNVHAATTLKTVGYANQDETHNYILQSKTSIGYGLYLSIIRLVPRDDVNNSTYYLVRTNVSEIVPYDTFDKAMEAITQIIAVETK